MRDGLSEFKCVRVCVCYSISILLIFSSFYFNRFFFNGLFFFAVQAVAESNCATVDITGLYPGTYTEISVNGLRADYQYVPDLETSTSTTSYSYGGGGTVSLYFEMSRRRQLAGSDKGQQINTGALEGAD